MDRFTRYKTLRSLWASARALLVRLSGPHHQDVRLRAQRWQHIMTTERNLLDGIVRGVGDPDATPQPHRDERRREAAAWQAQREGQRQWLARQHQQGPRPGGR